MLDFGRCDEQQLSPVRRVIEALASLGDINPHDLMVVGASCRDILHSALGHGFPLRGTTDVDVAIALPDWAAFQEITRTLEPIGATGVRYLIRSIPVDLVPFGDVEDPTGVVTPTRRDEDMSVFAFREVFDHASDLPLAKDLQIRIPTPPGFCALKMSAWANRSVVGELRDGPDIAAAVHWYTREFGHETIPDWPAAPARRAAVIDALCSGIWIRYPRV